MSEPIDIDAQPINLNMVKEKGKCQYEVHLSHTHNLLDLCNGFYAIKNQLTSEFSKQDIAVNFSPKPFSDDYGSAAHYHLSLYNLNQTANLLNTDIALFIVASILELVPKAMYMFTGDDDNEYQRFVPKFMAPINLSWGGNNRTALLRIPDNDIYNKRLEFRLPSSQAMPEDVILFLLIAALEGLEKKQMPIEKLYGEAHHEQYDLSPLPKNVMEAKKCFKFDSIIAKYREVILIMR